MSSSPRPSSGVPSKAPAAAAQRDPSDLSPTDAWAFGAPGERPRFDRQLLAALARAHGTPLYVYDLDHVVARLGRLGPHAQGEDPRGAHGFDAVRFAQKANTNLAVLGVLARAGARVDAVSLGELERALAAGFAPRDIQVTADALDRELAARLADPDLDVEVSVGSIGALEHVAALGRGRVALRVNPGFGAGHHAKVTTGGPATKHGVWHADTARAAARARELGVVITALHLHVGSGATHERRDEMIGFAGEALRVLGLDVERVSTGGGLPVPYRPEDTPFDPTPFAVAWRAAREQWVEARGGKPLELEVEPGRYLVAHAGVLVTEVLGANTTPSYRFLLVDAGFHTLARPAMYGAYHHVSALEERRDGGQRPTVPQVVAGPLCESSDLLTQSKGSEPDPRPLPQLDRGELLLVHDVGAYGATMASGYNARPLPAEVVLEGGIARLARAREDVLARIADERRIAGRESASPRG